MKSVPEVARTMNINFDMVKVFLVIEYIVSPDITYAK